MNSYNTQKLSIRPAIPTLEVKEHMASEEEFQNQSLRPILKLQHEILQLLVKSYFEQKKNAFYKLSAERKPGYLKDILLQDRSIVHELRGLVIGQFTTDEMSYYLGNKSEINKRIQSLLLQRISSFALDLV